MTTTLNGEGGVKEASKMTHKFKSHILPTALPLAPHKLRTIMNLYLVPSEKDEPLRHNPTPVTFMRSTGITV